MKHSRTVFAAKRVDDDYVLDVFDFIGEDWYGEGVSARSVAAKLTEAADASRIVVRLNSPGGDVFDGTTIYNLLRNQSAKVRVEIHGLAASMASIVALAGDEVVIATGAMFMIHNPWSIAMGEADDFKKTAAMLDKIKSNMLDIYATRSTASRDKLAKMMDDESWLSATEAVQHGFADSVIGEDDEAAAACAPDRMFANLSRYAKTPTQLLRQYDRPEGRKLVAAMREQPRKYTTTKARHMEDENTTKTPATASPVDKTPDAPSATLQDFVPRADYDQMARANAELRARMDKIESDALTERVDTEINAALKAGKITPATASYHRKCAMRTAKVDGKTGLDDFREFVGVSASIAGPESRDVVAESKAQAATAADDSLTDEEREICKNTGVSADAYIKVRNAREKASNPPTHTH